MHYFISYSQVLGPHNELLAIACAVSSPEGGPTLRKCFLGQAGELTLPPESKLLALWRGLPPEKRYPDLPSMEQALARWLPRNLPNRHTIRLGLVGADADHILAMQPVPGVIQAFWDEWYANYRQPDPCVAKDVWERVVFVDPDFC